MQINMLKASHPLLIITSTHSTKDSTMRVYVQIVHNDFFREDTMRAFVNYYNLSQIPNLMLVN